MKKNRILIPAFLLFFLLTGCSNLGFRINPTPIPEGMDETATVQAACDIVTLLSIEDYQAVVDKFRDDLVEEYNVSTETIRDMMDAISKAGSFVEVESTVAVGASNKDSGEEYAAVGVYAKHESKKVAYTISLDTDLALIGLQMKLR